MTGRLWRLGGPAVIAGVTVLMIGVLPAMGRTDDARARTGAAESTITGLEAELARLVPLVDSAGRLEAAREVLEALVPTDHDLPGVIVELDRFADRSGVELRDVVPAEVTGNDTGGPAGWSSVVLGVRVRGDYRELIEFVARIAAGDRLMIIDRIALVPDPDGGLVADVDVRVFAATARGVATGQVGSDPASSAVAPEEAT